MKMKTILQLAVLLPLVVVATGCATPYMIDRGRDAADIFTATVGIGGGAKARVGPLHAGLFMNCDMYGLRNGVVIKGDWFNANGGLEVDSFLIPMRSDELSEF